MGGQFCSDCSTCRQTEWSLATYLGRAKTNAAFQQHWRSWFTQQDVDGACISFFSKPLLIMRLGIVGANLNTVRIPLPFWIIEDLVNTKTEPYAQGGLDELVRTSEHLLTCPSNAAADSRPHDAQSRQTQRHS